MPLGLLPPDRSIWSVSDAMAEVLMRLVVNGGYRSILEFGAGWSSVVLSRALTLVGGGRLTSVEHQPRFSESCWSLVQQSNVDAALVPAALCQGPSRHGVLWRYAGVSRPLAARAPYDFVLIDAPPGLFGRASPLHDGYQFLAPGAVVVLDDASRPDERRIIRRWLQTYPGLQTVVLDETVTRGIAVLVHDGNKRARIAPRAIVGTTLDWWGSRRSAAATLARSEA